MGRPIRTHTFSTGVYQISEEEIIGLCSYPEVAGEREQKFLDEHNAPEFSISISPRLKGRKRMEIFIHESLHAEYPSVPAASEEEWVSEAASNISRLLWRLGYRA